MILLKVCLIQLLSKTHTSLLYSDEIHSHTLGQEHTSILETMCPGKYIDLKEMSGL
jgi:hypothetical protein